MPSPAPRSTTLNSSDPTRSPATTWHSSSAAPTWSRTPRLKSSGTPSAAGSSSTLGFALRSALPVPLPLGGQVFGSLFFLSRQTNAFLEDDVDFGRRVADHLALALSH